MFRRNMVILQDLLDNGARIDVPIVISKRSNTVLNIVLAAMMRLQYEAFDILLEANDHQFPDVSSSLQSVKDHIKEKKDEKLGEITAKHARWFRLRQFLKLKQDIDKGTTATQRKLMGDTNYPLEQIRNLNHNLMREIIKDYF